MGQQFEHVGTSPVVVHRGQEPELAARDVEDGHRAAARHGHGVRRREEAVEGLLKAEAMMEELGDTPDSYWLARTREALVRLGQA